MSAKDTRWQQRFQNFESALKHLSEAVVINDADIIQKAGLIHFFEMSFELAWKMMKDYLNAEGHLEIRSPWEAINETFEIGLINNCSDWLQALEDRKKTVLVYDEEIGNLVCNAITTVYFPLLQELHTTFQLKLK
ncbi:MAG TPA: HI0074 family nucleotidyltransferase substrate-binding subunit [Flavipsychrobacter sp.]|mgnify:CR=1 FL=1|nr:HI0074 family nucleotidyltransferase substrate-binding subunit [Flavipsychrobacter sp.]